MNNNPNTRASVFHGVVYALTVVGYLYLLARLYEQPFDTPYQLLQLIAGTLTYLLLRHHDLTAAWRPTQAGSVGTRVLISWGWIVGLLLFLGFFTRSAESYSRVVLLAWFLSTPLVLLAVHLLAVFVLRQLVPEASEGRSTIIVFANDSARVLSEKLLRSNGHKLLGYFDDRDEGRTGGGIPGKPLTELCPAPAP